VRARATAKRHFGYDADGRRCSRVAKLFFFGIWTGQSALFSAGVGGTSTCGRARPKPKHGYSRSFKRHRQPCRLRALEICKLLACESWARWKRRQPRAFPRTVDFDRQRSWLGHSAGDEACRRHSFMFKRAFESRYWTPIRSKLQFCPLLYRQSALTRSAPGFRGQIIQASRRKIVDESRRAVA